MKLTVKDLYDIGKGLRDLLDKELPTSVAFSIQRNFKKVTEEGKVSDEVRQKLSEKYKEFTDENGRFLAEHSEKQAEYSKELSELFEQEVDVDLRVLKLTDLGESITPRTLGLIEKIVKEEEE